MASAFRSDQFRSTQTLVLTLWFFFNFTPVIPYANIHESYTGVVLLLWKSRSVFMPVLIILFLLTGSFISPCLAGQEIEALRVENPPIIDGKLDESAWKFASPATDFIQLEPLQGQPATHETFAYVLYDDTYLYVGIVAMKSDMQSLAITATRRDSRMFSDDFVQVELDTYHDHRNCYVFALNALGTQVDGRVANEGSGMGHNSSAYAWDCDWQGRAWRASDRWSAEFAIPFAELRFPKAEQAIWGINFRRNDESLEEETCWSDLGNKNWAVSRFGHLVGLSTQDLNTRRPLELKPYGTIIKPQSSDDQESIDRETDAGLDIRYPFTNLTLDFTLNPDFAQIEADPDRVNLTDIPLRFPEKRPYFQEGAELFQMPVELFYSRRIEDLMYGGKMVGKLGPYSLAVIDAQARPEDEEDPTESNYAVARLIRDIGARSSVGLLLVNKQSAGYYDRAASTDIRLELPSDFSVSGQAALNWNRERPNSYALIGNLSRRTNTLRFRATAFDAGENFNVDTGFIPRTDRRGYRASMGYRYPLESSAWRRLYTGVEGEQLWDHRGRLMNEQVRLEFNVGYKDFFTFFGPGQYFHVTPHGERFTDQTLDLFAGWFPPKWASIRSRISIGKRDGKRSFFWGPGFSVRPTERLGLELNIQRLVEEDKLVYLTRRFSMSYQFTQRMHIKGSAEFTKEGDRRIFAVYGYEFQPESHFFLVYTDNREKDRHTQEESQERILFVKLSYLMKVKW